MDNHRPGFGDKRNRLGQLRAFCGVARLESVTGAAESLGLSPPAVSQQVRALEEEFGAELFVRNGPRISLTPNGRNLHGVASRLIGELDRLPDVFAEQVADAEVSGRVRIATGRAAMAWVVPRFIRRFRERHPEVGFELRAIDVDDALKRLRDRELDLVLGASVDVPQGIDRYPILLYDFMLIAPPDHPSAGRNSVSGSVEDMREVFAFPMVVPPSGTSGWRKIERAARQFGTRVDVAVEVAGWEAIKRYVEVGVGCAFVPDFCLAARERVSVIQLPQFFRNLVWCLYRHGRESGLSEAGERFVRFMEASATVETGRSDRWRGLRDEPAPGG